MRCYVMAVLPRARRESLPVRAVRERIRGPAGGPAAPHGDARRRRHLVQALWRGAGLEIRESLLVTFRVFLFLVTFV